MYTEYADALGFLPPVNVFDQTKKSAPEPVQQDVLKQAGIPLDFPVWLPFAAKEYQISKDPKDYILAPVISIPAGLPNRNGVAFPLATLLEWNVDHGMQAYRTFVGKPMFIEHNNSDHTKAIGVIVDAAMRPVRTHGQGKQWKLIKLAAIDRNKGYEVADPILSGDLNTYSMGAYVESYSCGYCGSPMGLCSHINKRNLKDFYVNNGRLVFRQVHNIVGFEFSVVKVPAFTPAASNLTFSL